MPTAAEIRAELERRKKAAPPPPAPTGNKPDPEAIKAELARRGVASQPSFFQRQGQRMVEMGTQQPDNVPVPVGQAQSAASGMFANEQAEEERRRQERTIFNSASPGLAFRDTGSKGTVELNDDGGDFGRGMRNLPLHAQRAAVGAAEAALNTPGDLAAVATVPYAMSFDPEMQGIMAGSEFGVGADTLLERIAGRVKSGGFDKMQQTLDNAPRFDFSAAKIPVPESEQSFTGALTEGFMQYLLARGAVGKVMPGGKLPTQLAKDVLATGVAFNGGTPRLADMLDPESMGFAADYIRWLKSQPGETGIVGRVKNMAEDATLNLIGMGIFRGAKASVDALSPQALTPTNAGGARPGPVSPPQPSVAPPVAPVAPVAQAPVPQGPPRMAQAGPASAGQQPAGGPQPVLNTVQTAPTVSKAQAREAKDTAVILGRILRAAGIKNNAIRGYLPGLIQRYESLGDSRIPLARFIERDLPQHFPEGVAGDAVAKLRGFGRERDASTGPNDTSRHTLQNTKKQLRSSQQDHLTEVIRSNTYRKDLIDAEDKIKADMRKNAEAGYETALANGLDRFTQNRAAPDEVAAFEQLRGLIASEPFLSRVPDHVRFRAIREGKPLEEAIAADPVRTAHWLQSALGKAERAAQGMGGKATPESILYNELREAVLDPLQKAVPGYKGARNAHGDLFGADEALEFGEDLFLAARSEVETARKARDFGKLSKQQQTVATMSIRDKLLNEFRGTPEDAAAKLTRMQQEGVLDAIERILGADGKRITAAIRETVEENDWLRSIDQGSGSPTFANAAGARDAAENVRGPINKAVGSLGDKRTYLGAVVGDVVLSSVGVPPVLTVGKATSDVVGAAGRPSARQLSNATKGLFGLPEPKPPATPPTRAPRGPRKPKAPEQLEADLETLLKRYDEIDHRNNPTESARVLKQIDALKKRVAKPPATTAPRRPPEQSGFGGAPRKGGNGTVSRIVAGGVVGGMAGTFAGEADAQSTETMGELERARKEREDVLAILADLQEQQKFFATASETELQKRLDREGFDLGPTGADGTIGPRTRDAIKGRKAEIEKEAEAARKRLASADSNLEKWERQAAFEKTRPTEAQQAFRDYAPLLGGIAGALGAKTARLGGSGISKLTAANHIKKSNALLNNAPIAPPKTAAQRAAVRAELDRRATSLNEFWQRGGSEKNVPFATKRDGSWEARPPKNVTPPAGLFPDKFIGRNVGAADVLIGGTGAIEAGLAWQNSEIIKEKLNTAIEVAKDKPTEANLARVQELEDQYAQAKAWMMLGAGVAAGTGIGVFTSKYASKRANVAKAEEELAILRRAIADLKKPPAASSKAAKPPPAPLPLASAPQAMLPAPASPPTPTPPLPPSRPRRRP